VKKVNIRREKVEHRYTHTEYCLFMDRWPILE